MKSKTIFDINVYIILHTYGNLYNDQSMIIMFKFILPKYTFNDCRERILFFGCYNFELFRLKYRSLVSYYLTRHSYYIMSSHKWRFQYNNKSVLLVEFRIKYILV